jgi:hypothetical protein
VYLAESAREGGFTSLIRARDNNDSFRRVQHKVVGYGFSSFYRGKRKVKPIQIIKVLGVSQSVG